MAHEMEQIIEDQFAELGNIKTRDMFGATGVYEGQDMFALVAGDRFFVKADEELRGALENKGGEAFIWTDPETGRVVQLSYVSVPEPEGSDPAYRLCISRKALSIAQELRRQKVKSPRRFAF